MSIRTNTRRVLTVLAVFGLVGKWAWADLDASNALVKNPTFDSALVIYEHAFPVSKGAGKSAKVKFILVTVHDSTGQVHKKLVFFSDQNFNVRVDPLNAQGWFWLPRDLGTKANPASPLQITTKDQLGNLEQHNLNLVNLKSPQNSDGSPDPEAASTVKKVLDAVATVLPSGAVGTDEGTGDFSANDWPVWASIVHLGKPPFTQYTVFRDGHNNVVPNPSPFFLTNGTIVVRGSYQKMVGWLLANYAANNTTTGAREAKEVLGGVVMRTVIRNYEGEKWVEMYPFYVGLDNKNKKGLTITHSFGENALENTGLSFGLDTKALIEFLSGYGPYFDEAYSPETVLEASKHPSEIPPVTAESAADDKKSLHKNLGPYKWPDLDFPNEKTDASGTELSSDVTLSPTDPDSLCPKLSVSGGKYLNRSYYDVSVSPTWGIHPKGDSWTHALGPQFSRTITPNGDYDKDATSGMMTWGVARDAIDLENPKLFATDPNDPKAIIEEKDANGLQLTVSFDESAGWNSSSNNAPNPLATHTDEYSGTSHAQQLFSKHLPLDTGDVASIDFSFDEWLKPTQSTQNSNFYTAAAGQCAMNADIPWPVSYFSGLDKSPEFFRVDAVLSGGDIDGDAPTTDQFFGGNDGAASASKLPTPVIRSFGTGKLGLYPVGGKGGGGNSGAQSFVNTSLTVALPFPVLAKRFVDAPDADVLNTLFQGTSPIVRDRATQDQLNFIANYDDVFSFRPLLTCDAAWLGAPSSKYSDRSLVSVGGGAEISVSVINFDLLYEVTLHDTEARQQPLGENIIVQMSYDIHF